MGRWDAARRHSRLSDGNVKTYQESGPVSYQLHANPFDFFLRRGEEEVCDFNRKLLL